MECEVQACRGCLATDVRLFSLANVRLRDFYVTISGDEVTPYDGLPQYLCWECEARARLCARFRQKCHRGRQALIGLLAGRLTITESGIRSVNRISLKLSSSLQIFQTCNLSNWELDNVKTETEDGLKINTDMLAEREFFNDTKPFGVDIDEAILLKSSTGTAIDKDIYDVKDSWYDGSHSPSIKSEDSEDDVPLARQAIEKNTVKKKKKLKHHKKNHKETKVERKRDNPPPYIFANVLLLSHDEQLAELRRRRDSLNYTNSPHKCDKCYKGFVDVSAFANHMRMHDPASGEYVCDICEIRCRTQRKLKTHAVNTHARKFQCLQCQHVSNSTNQAREHDKWHKGHVYSCNMCGETFRKSTTHLTHVRMRHPTDFVCGACGDAFVGEHGLAMHKARAHAWQKEVKAGEEVHCDECDVRFASVAAFTRHTVTSAKHGQARRHIRNICRACGAAFWSRADLTKHMATHVSDTSQPVPQNDHPPELVKCEQCDATFDSARNCLAHQRRMHLGIKYPIKKNIVCEVCGKKCTSNATLQYHQRTHTGEKPFQCSECPMRFSIRQRLQIHSRTHTGERPYPCPSCDKAFRHKPALNRHSRVHSGIKPYECNYCGKTFTQSNSMKLHVRTVHHKLPAPYRSRANKPPVSAAVQ